MRPVSIRIDAKTGSTADELRGRISFACDVESPIGCSGRPSASRCLALDARLRNTGIGIIGAGLMGRAHGPYSRWFEISSLARLIRRRRNSSSRAGRRAGAYADAYKAELDALLSVPRANKPTLITPHQGRQVPRLAECAIQSARSGRRVAV